MIHRELQRWAFYRFDRPLINHDDDSVFSGRDARGHPHRKFAVSRDSGFGFNGCHVTTSCALRSAFSSPTLFFRLFSVTKIRPACRGPYFAIRRFGKIREALFRAGCAARGSAGGGSRQVPKRQPSTLLGHRDEWAKSGKLNVALSTDGPPDARFLMCRQPFRHEGRIVL